MLKTVLHGGLAPITLSAEEMHALSARLRRVSPQEEFECPVCIGRSSWFCTLDFAVCGNDYFTGYRNFAETGLDILYFRCQQCGFLFSPCFWDFTIDDYRRFIYNDTYVLADPPFDVERPLRDAATLHRLLSLTDGNLRIIDYGGGRGSLAARMREYGFPDCVSYDPIYGGGDPAPKGPFDVIACFEVIEHVKEQREFAQSIKKLLSSRGFMLLSTQVQPSDLRQDGAPWWYIEPRNGHISIHTLESLKFLFWKQRLMVSQLCQDLFVICSDNGLPIFIKAHTEDVRFRNELCANRNPLPPT